MKTTSRSHLFIGILAIPLLVFSLLAVPQRVLGQENSFQAPSEKYSREELAQMLAPGLAGAHPGIADRHLFWYINNARHHGRLFTPIRDPDSAGGRLQCHHFARRSAEPPRGCPLVRLHRGSGQLGISRGGGNLMRLDE